MSSNKPGESVTARTKPRGELAELSNSLQNLCTTGKRTDKELRQAKKDVFKKVINYMTLGMDMSGLFPMMTSCANLSSDDLVLKKMLYLYITHYAALTPDIALLGINQLHKDCHDQDPTVRGLALRSLCSLRVPNFVEYVVSCCACGRQRQQRGCIPCTNVTSILHGSTPLQLAWHLGHDSEQPMQVASSCIEHMHLGRCLGACATVMCNDLTARHPRNLLMATRLPIVSTPTPLCMIQKRGLRTQRFVSAHRAHQYPRAHRIAVLYGLQVAPINSGLEDRHPYVRRTAVLGVLKVRTWDSSNDAWSSSLCMSFVLKVGLWQRHLSGVLEGLLSLENRDDKVWQRSIVH